MAAEQLSIELTANITNFRQNLAAAATELNRTGQQAQTASNQISQNIARVNAINLSGFNRALQQGQVSVQRLGTVTAALPAQINRTSTAITQSAEAVRRSQTNYMNFGRVIQDLPFGLIGIQNNLTQLIPSIGAWGLAFSVLVSGLTFAQTGLANWTRGLDGNAAATKKAKKETDEYAESITGVAKAELEGSKSAQEDLNLLKSLYGAYQDANLTLANRKLAYKQLQQEYPDYFKNLRFEQTASDKTRQIYDALTESILKTARARAAMSLIEENSKTIVSSEAQILAIQKQKIDLINQETASIEKRVAFQNKSYTTQQKGFLISKEAKQDQIDQIKNLDKVKKLDDQIFDIAKGRNELRKQNESLEGFVRGKQGEGVTLVDLDAAEKAGSKIKSLAEILKELNQALAVVDVQMNSTFGERNEGQIKAYQSAIDAATKSFGAQSKAVQDLIAQQKKLFQLPSIKTGSTDVGKLAPKNTAKVGGKVDTSILANLSKVQQEMLLAQATIYQAQDDFNKDFNQLVQTGLVDSLSGIGEAIGTALIEGGDVFASIGNSLLAGFGQFLSQFGKLLVEYGAAAILKSKLDAAILIPGAGLFAGAAAIAAGIALQVAAAAFSSLAGKGSKSSSGGRSERVTAFANGGIISGPTLGLMGEYSGAKTNPEVVAPLNKLKSMLGDTSPKFEVIQYIEGDKLAVLVRNANNRLGRI